MEAFSRLGTLRQRACYFQRSDICMSAFRVCAAKVNLSQGQGHLTAGMGDRSTIAMWAFNC